MPLQYGVHALVIRHQLTNGQVIRERFQYLLQCGNIVFFGEAFPVIAQGMVIVRGNSVKERQTCLVSDFPSFGQNLAI